jgi:hypothetical protein
MSNNDETNPSSIPAGINMDNPAKVENVTVSETSMVENSDRETSFNATSEDQSNVSEATEPELVVATEPDLAVATDPEPAVATDPEPSVDVASEEVAEIPTVDKEARVRELQETRLVLEREAQSLIEEISMKDESAQRFAVWVDHHQRTFLWKMLSKMNEQLDRIMEKQNEFEATVSAVDLPKPGELVRYRKRFHKTILSGLAGVGTGGLIWWLILNFVPYGFLAKLAVSTAQVVQWLIGIFTSTLLAALILYYRDWRRFDWKVKSLNRQLRDVAKGVDFVRTEEVRLASLYPQVKDWLEIIGYSLNRPWSMNSKWFKSYMSDLNQDEFPFSLRIAQAQEQDAASMHELQGNTMKRYTVRGWRTQVLKDQILAIAQKVGLPVERMNVDGVDKDISYSPGGPRNELRKGLENIDALELVARRQLIPLTFKVQSEEITKSRPPVKENRTNALDEIQADLAGLEEDERVDWDDFLKEPIGPFDGVVTPFSVASLEPSRIQDGFHLKIKSYFVVPKRMEALAAANPGALVETYSESTNLPMDIVIRMDLSEKLPPHAIKINPPSAKTVETMRSPIVNKEEDEDDD